jgi:hypothetical protein
MLAIVAAVAAGCGGDHKETTSYPAAPLRPTVKPTATDLKIVRLVQTTGGRLHLDAITLFGDRALLADKGTLSAVAAARQKTATQLEHDAAEANDKLRPLGEKATAADQVAEAGTKAFDELASCGRKASAFFRKAAGGNAGSLSGPEAACKRARLAYGQATTVADLVKPPAK